MSNVDTATTTAVAPAVATQADAPKRESVAKHELIAERGGKHVDITEATGIRYMDKSSGTVFEYMIPNAKAGDPITLLALFGAKTKATNEASRVRNGQGGDTEAQFEAIDEVFANIDKGVWREKAEGGSGSRARYDVLAAILVEMLGDKAQGTVDTYQNRLETDEDYRKKVRSNPDIAAEYKKRTSKTQVAVTDLV